MNDTHLVLRAKVLVLGVTALATPVFTPVLAAAFIIGDAPIEGPRRGDWATVGLEFTSVADIHVTALGSFDPEGDGFAGSLLVGIVDVTDASHPLLIPAGLPSGRAAPIDGEGFRYVTIAPVHLAAGRSYVIAQAGSMLDHWSTISNDPGVDPAISIAPPASGYIDAGDPIATGDVETLVLPVNPGGFAARLGPISSSPRPRACCLGRAERARAGRLGLLPPRAPGLGRAPDRQGTAAPARGCDVPVAERCGRRFVARTGGPLRAAGPAMTGTSCIPVLAFTSQQ